MGTLKNKNILLVISGGIAAYKSLELIRLIRKSGGAVRCILTKGGAQFVTPLSIAALSESEVYTDLFSLKDETEMGHIRLSREADLIVVAPASANIIARLAWGLTDDLASTALLAANKPILLAPAMNHKMWSNEATQDNMNKLLARGCLQVGPTEGEMACNEFGMGRMAEPEDILKAIEKALTAPAAKNIPAQKKTIEYLKQTRGDEKFAPLEGYTALVTSGPTFEPIDPVRFIGNRSSGKQGTAIALALAAAGAKVILVAGPLSFPCPPKLEERRRKGEGWGEGRSDEVENNIKVIHVTTAAEMLAACEQSLPVDIAVFAAAVSDWTPEKLQSHKIKKRENATPPTLALKENPDILKTITAHKKRPQLVIGFAAETENLVKNAQEKLQKKNADWILANDVSKGVFGEDETHLHLITRKSTEDWKKQTKLEAAQKLVQKIAAHFHRAAPGLAAE